MYWAWPDTLYTIAVVCGICGTGLFEVARERRELHNRLAFAAKFRSQFATYGHDPTQELQAYTWLIINSAQMQADMGGFGKYEQFTDGRFMYKNYPIILNLIPLIRSTVENDQRHPGLFGEDTIKYMNMVDEAVLRHLGALDYRLKHSPSPWNPAILFREGIRAWIASPLMLLVWLGVVSTPTVARVTQHPAFKVLSGAVTVVGLIGTVFTIALGWGDMHKLVSTWLAH